jgi:alpha-L-fucosidase
MTSGVYTPTKSSLNTHRVPTSFEDAKFGIFIHWGLFSVPGFAPKTTFTQVLQQDYDRAILVNPYAEQYWNAIKDPATPSATFHRSHYNSMAYQGFKPLFIEGLKHWDPYA